MSIEERFRTDSFLSELSTFGIGGPIRYYLEAKEMSDIEEAVSWTLSHRIPYFILGKGSNCLFDDRGFHGLVIHNKIDFCKWQGAEVLVGAGMSFSFLGMQAAKRALSGLEFASGIPGSVGGAVYMNAGANGQETCQSLREIIYFLEETGEKRVFARADLPFSYRTSPFQSMRGCILAARFLFTESEHARKTQLALLNARKKTQPLGEKSAGCIFRNPPHCSAGALIDSCGLKGMIRGGAKISETHANFIVNISQAKTVDVLTLIDEIQKTVFEKTGIWLEPEVRQILDGF